MSNKLNTGKSTRRGAGTEIVGQLTEYLLAVVTGAICVIVPLYAKDGYDEIGEAKFTAYKIIMEAGFPLLMMLALLYGFFYLRERKKCRLSVTDKFVLAYLLLTALAAAFGGFAGAAWKGAFGWNMGLMAQTSFVLLYLFLSRFGKHYREILTVMCMVAAGVFLIAILHRAGIDPIGHYRGLSNEQKAQFLSTVGQATWYASYLVVALPVGIAVFLYSDQKVWRILGGIYTALGFGSLVTQNSDSAYFALAGFMLVFFWVCVEKKESLRRFVVVCTMFFGIGKIMYFLMRIHPNPELTYDFVTWIVLCSGLTWGLLVICLVLCILLYVRKGETYPLKLMLWVRRAVVAAAGVVILGAVLLIILQAKELLPDGISQKLSKISYFNWNHEWGNGRGKIWQFAASVFMQESLPHKLFGVGPDCMSNYMRVYHAEELWTFWKKKVLTNAHNEWLSMLINGGILGTLSYMGIFFTAVRRFLAKDGREFLLVGITAAVVSYMAYNFFCYQQVCCTPFVFILLGIGEYINREDQLAV